MEFTQNFYVNIKRIAAWLISLTLILILIIVAKPILLPVLLGFLLAALLSPIANWFKKYLKNAFWSGLLAFIAILVPIGLIFSLIYGELARIFQEMPSVLQRLTEGINTIANWINGVLDSTNLGFKPITISDISSELEEPLLNFGQQGLMSSTIIIGTFFLSLLFGFLILLYKDPLKSFVIYQFDQDRQGKMRQLVSKIKYIIQGYAKGLFLVMAILAVVNSLGLYLIGINYAVFWGVLAAFLAIIPYIGTTIGGLLPFLYAIATTDNIYQPLAVVVFYFLIQQIEGNFITPKVVGSSVSINPLAAIIGLFIGALIWGIAGVILAIPFLAILRAVFDEIPVLKPYGLLISDSLFAKGEKFFSEDYNDDEYRLFSSLK